MAVISYICIVYIMFNGAQRLEKRQMARYGNDPEYKGEDYEMPENTEETAPAGNDGENGEAPAGE